MACHFFLRRMPLPDGEFLRKVPRQMTWRGTFPGGANPCSDKPWRGGLVQKWVPGNASGGHTLRTVRAVEALEYLATPQARQLLQALAKGAAGTRQTREAQESLDRPAKRTVVTAAD